MKCVCVISVRRMRPRITWVHEISHGGFVGARIHTKADADLWALLLGQSVELHNDIKKSWDLMVPEKNQRFLGIYTHCYREIARGHGEN